MSSTPMDREHPSSVAASLIADAVERADTGELGEVWAEVDRRRQCGEGRKRERKATPDAMTRRH